MRKIFATAFFVFAFICFSYAQNKKSGKATNILPSALSQQSLNNNTPSSAPLFGIAPVQARPVSSNDIQPNAGNPLSRAFCYNGAGPFQLNKQSLLNTTLTPIGATVAFGFPGAAAWVTTTNTLYVIDQLSPFALYTVDTLTGVRTFVANCTGVPQANFTGMTWDPTSSTMYGASTTGVVSQIFTINIATGVCTPIGSATATAPGVIMLNAAPGGSLFSTDIVNDALYRWNKTTGVPTLIGLCGFDVAFGQDGHFDLSDGQYFWAAYNNTAGQAQLRIIDTTSGASTFVGSYAGQVETFAIYNLPLTPCSGTPAPGNTLSSVNPVGPGQPFTLSLQNPPLATGITHQWQSSPNGTTWTNIVGATNGTYATSQVVATYYRDSVRCTNSSQFGISTPLLVNMGCGWFSSTAYPIAISDQGVATVGSNMYSFGGVSSIAGGLPVTNSYKFDGTTWTAIASLPAPLEDPSVATDGVNIYIMGGYDGSGVTPNMYRYNVASNTYTSLAPMPTNTWNAVAVYLNGKIYKFTGGTGATGATEVNALEIYNIAANTWSAGANYPAALLFVRGVAIGNNIYGAGGTTALGVASAKTYRYDPVTNTWDDGSIADIPAACWGGTAGVYNGKFDIAGGIIGGVSSTVAISWNPNTNIWSSLPNMTTAQFRMAGSALNASFYVTGGTPFNGTTTNQQLACPPPPPCSGTPASPGNTLTSSTTSTLLPNGGFETGSFAPWVVQATNPTPVVNNTSPRTGVYAAFLGNNPGAEPLGDASIFQSFAVPAGGATLSFWYKGYTEDGITFDWQDAYITNATGTTNLATIFHICETDAGYVNVTYNLSAYAGQTIGVKFLVHQDGFGDVTNMYVDDVSLLIQGNVVCPGELFTLSAQNPVPDQTGFAFQWQSSPDNIQPYTDIIGATSATLTTSSATFPKWYRLKVTCTNSNQSVFSTPLQMLSGQGVFTSQPANVSTQCGSNATFNFAATGKDLSYSWEYRTSSASPTWFTVPNSGVYSGANTNTLTLTNVPGTMSGYQYRGLMQGPCTAVDYTNIVTLTVTPLIAIVNPSSATICTGSIQKLSISNATTGVVNSFASGTVNIPIPDGVLAGINHTMPISGIPAGSVITGISVKLNITHTYVSDLEIVLKEPSGKIINLDDLVSGTNQPGQNFINTIISSAGVNLLKTGTVPGYTGTFKADLAGAVASFGVPGGPTGFSPNTQSWATFMASAQTNPNGNWTIAMYDAGPPDAGTLNNWSLDITYGAPLTGTWTASPSAPNTMFTDAAATVPYTGTSVNTIYVKPTVNTNYTVVVTSPTPCTSNPLTIPVSVTNPVANLTIPAAQSVCVGNSTTITATANGGPITWQWQVSNNNGVTYTDISGATSASLTLTNVTQLMNNYRYRVVATASPCGIVTSAVYTLLTVNPLPTVTLSANPSQVMPGVTTFVVANSSPAGAQYAWTRNGTPITGATTSSVFADVDGLGSYKVTVTDVNGCVSTSSELVISATDNPRLFIYPNPNNGQFQARLYFNSVALYEVNTIRIFNAAGQVVITKTFPITSQYVKMDFDLRGHASGVYVARVTHRYSGKTVSARFVIQN